MSETASLNELPYEIFFEIIQYIDIHSIFKSFPRINRMCYQICQKNSLWFIYLIPNFFRYLNHSQFINEKLTKYYSLFQYFIDRSRLLEVLVLSKKYDLLEPDICIFSLFSSILKSLDSHIHMHNFDQYLKRRKSEIYNKQKKYEGGVTVLEKYRLKCLSQVSCDFYGTFSTHGLCSYHFKESKLNEEGVEKNRKIYSEKFEIHKVKLSHQKDIIQKMKKEHEDDKKKRVTIEKECMEFQKMMELQIDLSFSKECSTHFNPVFLCRLNQEKYEHERYENLWLLIDITSNFGFCLHEKLEGEGRIVYDDHAYYYKVKRVYNRNIRLVVEKEVVDKGSYVIFRISNSPKNSKFTKIKCEHSSYLNDPLSVSDIFKIVSYSSKQRKNNKEELIVDKKEVNNLKLDLEVFDEESGINNKSSFWMNFTEDFCGVNLAAEKKEEDIICGGDSLSVNKLFEWFGVDMKEIFSCSSVKKIIKPVV